MAPHSSTLAWKIPWTEEPGRLQSMGSLRVRHDWVTSLSCIGEGNGNPLQCSCLEIPRDGGAWWAVISGVAQSRTWLKRLSSSSMYNRWVLLDSLLSSLEKILSHFDSLFPTVIRTQDDKSQVVPGTSTSEIWTCNHNKEKCFPLLWEKKNDECKWLGFNLYV